MDSFANIPDELKKLKQWALSNPDRSIPDYKKPLTVTGKWASSTDPNDWTTFKQAVKVAREKNWLIGFMLTKEDPYVVIDFDAKDIDSVDKNGLAIPSTNWTPEHALHHQDRFINETDTYKELSMSGKGYHAIVEYTKFDYKRFNGVEVFSFDRYVILTGWAFKKARREIVDGRIQSHLVEAGTDPINKPGELLKEIIDHVRTNSKDVDKHPMIQTNVSEEEADQVIIDRAMAARNGEYFKTLWQGDWRTLNIGDLSQSSADYALMNLLAFYTASNSQAIRLFRMSALGQRKKAQRNDYLMNTLAGKRAEIDYQKQLVQSVNFEAILNRWDVINEGDSEVYEDCFQELTPLSFPPGVMGELARFIYNSSTYPEIEIAVTGALAFACMLGRSYSVRGAGLNNYVILVAESGTGKESMLEGINYIISCLEKHGVHIGDYFVPSSFASPQALIKEFAIQSTVVNIKGEIGKFLKELSSKGAPAPVEGLKNLITEIYPKSGPKSRMGGIKYSDGLKNVKLDGAVSYSLIGESTPGIFVEAMTSEMMEDGFLSRLLIIEHKVDINKGLTPFNENRIYELDKDLVDKLDLVCKECILLGVSNREVLYGESSAERSKAFRDFCRKKIFTSKLEGFKHLWNRAHLKSVKIAAQMAILDNPVEPVISNFHIHWAINIVLNDVTNMLSKFAQGEVGSSDNIRADRIRALCTLYLKMDGVKIGTYDCTRQMQKDSVITYRFFADRCKLLSAFKEHNRGGIYAVQEAVKYLVDIGLLIEMPKETLITTYNYRGKAYRILKTK